MNRIDRLLSRWQSSGILAGWQDETRQEVACPPGATSTAIAAFERRYGVLLPADMREYFLAVNGMGPADEVFDDGFNSFWRIEDLQTIAEWEAEVARGYPNARSYFIFADHSLHIETYAIRLNSEPNIATPVARVHFNDGRNFDMEDAFASFGAFLDSYLASPFGIL